MNSHDALATQRTVLIADHGGELAAGMADELKSRGWEVLSPDRSGAAVVDGLVYDAGLLDGGRADASAAVGRLTGDLRALLDGGQIRPGGGLRVVAVASRDLLGAWDDTQSAAAAGALASAVRSLALELGRAGVTANLVVGMPRGTDRPKPLLSRVPDDSDLAETVAFLLDRRSSYITGQIVYCCGGAQLLSSLSS